MEYNIGLSDLTTILCSLRMIFKRSKEIFSALSVLSKVGNLFNLCALSR